MTHYAQIEAKNSRLCEDFGREFVYRRFPKEVADAIFEALPRYTRGPRKGKVKGYIVWNKVTKGGWVRTGPSYHGSPSGHVAYPGTQDVKIVLELSYEREQDGIPAVGYYTDQTLEDRIAQSLRHLRQMEIKEFRSRRPYAPLPADLQPIEV